MGLTVADIERNPYLVHKRTDLTFDLYMVAVKTDPHTYPLIDVSIRKKYLELADVAVNLLSEVAAYVPLSQLNWDHILRWSSSLEGCKLLELHLDDYPSFNEVFLKLIEANAPELRSNLAIFDKTDAEFLFNLFQSYRLKVDNSGLDDLNF